MALQDAIDFIRRNSRFAVTTHESADADGIGSEYALVKGLRALGKECEAMNGEPLPSKWRFIDPEGIIQNIASVQPVDFLDDRAVILLDTNDPSNAAIPEIWNRRPVADLFVLDHHEALHDLDSQSWLDPSMSSTCEMVLRLLQSLGVSLDAAIASALFAGMSFDTGSFSYQKTSEHTFDAARLLVAEGASPSRTHALLHESQTTAALLLMQRAVKSLEIHGAGKIAVQTLLRSDFADIGARYEDAEDLINIPLVAKDIAVSILFKQNPEGLLRCSLRSKGDVNVAAIAQKSGGGGHRTAAGFKCSRSASREKKAVISEVKAALEDGRG